VLHVPAEEVAGAAAGAAAGDLISRGYAYLAGGVERLLDTAGGPHPGGTGLRAAERVAAAIARELPVISAGGLNLSNVADAVRVPPIVGVDVASGVERVRPPPPRDSRPVGPVARPRTLCASLFAKRARAARDDRPNLASGPTLIHAGLIDRTTAAGGDGARLRRAIRPRDADGRARAARDGVRRGPPGPGLQ
jgi:hypothetical protein